MPRRRVKPIGMEVHPDDIPMETLIHPGGKRTITRLEKSERLLFVENLINKRYTQHQIVNQLKEVFDVKRQRALTIIEDVRLSRMRDFEATDESRKRRTDAINAIRDRIRRLEEAPDKQREALFQLYRAKWLNKEDGRESDEYESGKDVKLQESLVKVETDFGLILSFEKMLSDLEGTKQAQEVNINVGFTNALNTVVASIPPELAYEMVREMEETMRAAAIADANPAILLALDGEGYEDE